MKSKLLALFLLAGSSIFAEPRFGIGFGVNFGGGYYAPPPPLPVVSYAAPYAPGPGYSWVGGYWYPAGPRYAWRSGYWARPPYARAYWVGPRYYRHSYYPGYWHR
ncbi:MAG: hypothetical protein M3Y72_21600 [Acidobacteriota bacterium]|nr:hypothetical protein [Acidobacteriota bacterium]